MNHKKFSLRMININRFVNNKNKWMSNKGVIHVILFLLSILGVSWFYNYFEIFNFAPFGPHSWRQTDSCAFVQTYYNHGLDFFQPRIHHNIFGEGF